MDNEDVNRVLIVDDDANLRASLERSLRRLGYEVASAADGEEGLRLALAHPPSVMLLDIQMPRIDGHTLLRRLNTQDLDAAVVVMSAHGTMDDVIDALRNGAVDFLKKPWTASELVAAVGRAAELSEARRTIRRARLGTGRQSSPGAPRPRSEPALQTPAPSDVTNSVASVTQEQVTTSVTHLTPAAPAPESSGSAPGAGMAGEEFATIVEQLRRGELRMPAVPRVLIDLRALVRKPDATVEEVASLIERDQRTAAQVIRLANSALSTGLTRVNDIRGAITRIGFRQVENLAEASFAQGCYRIADARFRPLQSKLWRYSLARAVAMRALAEAAGPASGLDPALAYLAGLMGDSGAAFLLWLTAERERTSPSALIGDALVDCLAQIRTHHEELGGAMMRKWGMDPVIASVAETHHASQPPAPANRYWSLTVLASDLANQLAPGDDITRSHTTGAALLERAGSELRIGDSLLKRVLAKLSKEIDAILDTLAA